MCSECHRSPCLPGCPNAPEHMPLVVGYCDMCGEAIHTGEPYYDLPDGNVHMDCLEDWVAHHKRTCEAEDILYG